MYWDVVEVKPEPEYSLFVKFQDGLSGRVRLTLGDLTGALAPLRDKEFFERVYIEYGAITWPGNIDLAPDAMHRQVRWAEIEAELRSLRPAFGSSQLGTTWAQTFDEHLEHNELEVALHTLCDFLAESETSPASSVLIEKIRRLYSKMGIEDGCVESLARLSQR